MSNDPILFIDADEDDQVMFRNIMTELGQPHPVVILSTGQEALDYLRTASQPAFLILAEVSMPGMNGLQLRRQIDQNPVLRRKSIPFIFMTYPVEDHLVEEAYELTIQGLFEKPTYFNDWKEQMRLLVEYWTQCKQPNRLKRQG